LTGSIYRLLEVARDFACEVYMSLYKSADVHERIHGLSVKYMRQRPVFNPATLAVNVEFHQQEVIAESF
jgi:hypothetical protein